MCQVMLMNIYILVKININYVLLQHHRQKPRAGEFISASQTHLMQDMSQSYLQYGGDRLMEHQVTSGTKLSTYWLFINFYPTLAYTNETPIIKTP
jgi:hypothetical protein